MHSNFSSKTIQTFTVSFKQECKVKTEKKKGKRHKYEYCKNVIVHITNCVVVNNSHLKEEKTNNTEAVGRVREVLALLTGQLGV